MDVILHSVLPFLAMLVVLIVVHELGHFFTAKWAGVQVLEFGIGYPPKLWGIKRGETEYTINALPLGGFVRLLGEEDPSDPRSLAAKPRPTRLLVLSAGALMNFILPVFLFSLSYMIPQEASIGRAVITEVAPDSPAAKAGLQPGDVVLKINNRTINNVADLSYNVRLNLGSQMTMRVQRTDPATHQSEIKDLRVRARWAPPDGQ